ncbi:NTP transferase domain-containing protein [Sphingopyxis sp.]|jgi:GTP:adenosylcobinamide-phosphate guanylyltransferase|uniref:NTP transferase domain-containing protein n=1 Tax=Sphingopyxis sp. TaxID=1908224 RepID=UPI0025F28B01|nr:NTP transferase domain-containing protein [Sphingopyxis sp.]MBK6414616.1 NTP transferase domain-containing protein [Sphingopyxis sp.]
MTGSILILAGRRPGAIDPLAATHDVADKCLVPVAGRPMIAHVLSSAAATAARQIFVSTHHLGLLADLNDPVIERLGDRLIVVPAAGNLADSVLAVAGVARFPLLITTADNCMLTPETIAEISAEAKRLDVEAGVALARREDVLAAHPEGQRRFYEFSDVAVSNCNAYWIGHPGALKAAEAFRGGGQFVKKPLRVMQAFGLINLLRFRFGLGPIHHIFARISRHLNLEVAPLLVSNGATAIDVDNERSLRVTEALMARRVAVSPPPSCRESRVEPDAADSRQLAVTR